MEPLQEIIDYFCKHNIKIENVELEKDEIEIIHNLIFKNDFKEDVSNDSRILFWYGLYFLTKYECSRAKKYLLIAFENGSSSAAVSLGNYRNKMGDYESMKRYYLMAIEKGNDYAMNNLGHHYYKKKDYENMKKYFLMAIEKGNSNAMYNLAYYYMDQKDYENMKKYFLMAAGMNNESSIKAINDYLEVNFDICFACEAYHCLGEANLRKLNEKICEHHKLAEELKSFTDATTKFECINCYNLENCVFLKCGHGICYKCHGQSCRLCSNQIGS